MNPIIQEIYRHILIRKKPIEVVEVQDNVYRIWLGKYPFRYLTPKGIKKPEQWHIKNREWYNKRVKSIKGMI